MEQKRNALKHGTKTQRFKTWNAAVSKTTKNLGINMLHNNAVNKKKQVHLTGLNQSGRKSLN